MNPRACVSKVLAVTASAVAALVLGCGSSTTALGDDPGAGAGTPGGSGSQGTAGAGGAGGAGTSGSGSGTGSGSSGGGGGEACGNVTSEATLVKRPVDIIFIIDNSGSMQDEIDAVEANVNVSFANIIGASTLDYRVVMISKYAKVAGAYTAPICVSAPLSGNGDCKAPPPTSVDGPRFFQLDQGVNSHDSLRVLLATYESGWKKWMRPGAARVFVDITDDESDIPHEEFDAKLLAMDPVTFGTAAQRNYVFHAIAGFEGKAASAAWLPSEPVVERICGGEVVDDARRYQRLAILTGGLRFPICDEQRFDVVFKAIAEGVVSGTQVACDFPLPAVPTGKTLDKVRVSYTPSAGADRVFTPAASEAECADDRFVVDAANVRLCPQTCAAVRADSQAKVKVHFTCNGSLN